MRKQTWQQWARVQMKDPTSPSALGKGALAALTGQDAAALDAIAACWEMYGVSDAEGQRGVLAAVRALVQVMLPHNRWIARELIPFGLNWEDRDRLWPQIEPIEASGLVDPGRLRPKAQAEFCTHCVGRGSRRLRLFPVGERS